MPHSRSRAGRGPMSDQTDSKLLHLPSLSIEGFRGIDHLRINRLGRVTLLAGRNGVGKTSVLDAIRLFADRGHWLSLVATLERNEEIAPSREDSSVEESPDFEALFFSRTPVLGSTFVVGMNGEDSPQLRVEVSSVDEQLQETLPIFRRAIAVSDGLALRVSFGEFEEYLPMYDGDGDLRRHGWPNRSRIRRSLGRDSGLKTINCHSLGPGLLDNDVLDELWGEIALTPSEPLALEALRLGASFGVDGIAVVPGVGRSYRRRVVVKLNGGQRVPLRSLGDGAARLFGVAVALANAAGGFLLIDEAENGIHHELQADFWKLVLRASQEHNVQVVATTHSWDCIVGFSAAASENESAEGVVVRLERDGDGMRAVEYSEDELEVAAAQGIEVR